MKESRFSILKLLFILNDLLLLPCVYVTLWTVASKFMAVGNIWTRNFLSWSLPVVLLNCFYIPYISSALISCIYLRVLQKNKFPKSETVGFVILLLICMMGLISLDRVFDAAMSV